MKNPKISVIVPVYNVEKYLHKCIDSILAQTFTDFELLLIDDGSTDKSDDICDEYAVKDARVRVFHTENRGVSAARNHGLREASGDWICFVDSDDWVENCYLEYLYCVDGLDENNDCIVCQSVYVDFEVDGKVKSNKWFVLPNLVQTKPFDEKVIINKILNGYNSFVYAKLFNKQTIRENEIYFNESLSINEDKLFFHKYLQYVDKIYLSSFVSYHYLRRDMVSLSKMNHTSEEQTIAADELLKINEVLIEKFPITNILLQKKLYNRYGLGHIYSACRRVNKNNYVFIFHHIRKYKYLFEKYYMPSRIWQKLFMSLCLCNWIPISFIFLASQIYKIRTKY